MMMNIILTMTSLLCADALVSSRVAFRPTSTRVFASESVASLKETITSLKACNNITRTDLNELILSLEKSNPTSSPADSKLINGVWSLASSGFGTPGLIAFQALKAAVATLPFKSDEGSKLLDAEDITLTISSVQPRVEASTKIKVIHNSLIY
jgi:hypothetical protein